MAYTKFNAETNIWEVANTQLDSDWLPIVRDEDGAIVEPLGLAKQIADSIENVRVSSIKAKAGELINEQYPSYKQLNIIRLGGQDLEDMTAYIDGIRVISNQAEIDGTALEDVNWKI